MATQRSATCSRRCRSMARRISAAAASGPLEGTCSKRSMGVRDTSWNPDRTRPGSTTVTETPVPCSSWPRLSPSPVTANFVAPYTACSGEGSSPRTLETKTSWPRPRRSMDGSTRWVMFTTPIRLVSTTAR